MEEEKINIEKIQEDKKDEVQTEETQEKKIDEFQTELIQDEKSEEETIKEIEEKLDSDIQENEIETLKEQLRTKISSFEHKPKTIKIDEKYISEQPPEIQKVLRPIKGDILTERALKNYINAQLFIEKQKQYKKVEKQDFEQVTTKTTPQEFILTDEIKDDFNNTLYSMLKAKYKDMPEQVDNPEEAIKDYLTDIQISDPIKYYKFLKDYDLATEKLKENISQIKYLEKNWEQISANNIKKDVEKFENELKEYNLSLKDLGLELELDENYYNKYLYDNILVKNGQANPEVVQFINDKILLVPEGAVYKKLLELNYKKILTFIQNNKSQIQTKENKLPPSMSSYSSANTKPIRTNDNVENILELGVNEIDDEIIEKYKEQIKSSITGIK